MDINDLTIGQAKELAAMFGASPNPAPRNSAYRIGANYMLRTVTHIVTGRLVAIFDDGIVVEDAAWIADTGRFADALLTGSFLEVEPAPDGARVIVNYQAMIDAYEIATLPRVQK